MKQHCGFNTDHLCFSQVIALRELFKVKSGNSSEFLAEELTREIGMPLIEKEDIKTEVQSPEETRKMGEVALMEDEIEKIISGRKSLMDLDDAADEFFDVPEPTEYCQYENEWHSELSAGQNSPVLTGHKR